MAMAFTGISASSAASLPALSFSTLPMFQPPPSFAHFFGTQNPQTYAASPNTASSASNLSISSLLSSSPAAVVLPSPSTLDSHLLPTHSKTRTNQASIPQLLPKPVEFKSIKEEPGFVTEMLLKNRRENHRAVERRRRDHINIGIQELSRIVPGCQRSKGKILHKTADYVQQLIANEKAQNQQMKKSQLIYSAHVTHLQKLLRQELESRAKEKGQPIPTNEELEAFWKFDPETVPLGNLETFSGSKDVDFITSLDDQSLSPSSFPSISSASSSATSSPAPSPPASRAIGQDLSSPVTKKSKLGSTEKSVIAKKKNTSQRKRTMGTAEISDCSTSSSSLATFTRTSSSTFSIANLAARTQKPRLEPEPFLPHHRLETVAKDSLSIATPLQLNTSACAIRFPDSQLQEEAASLLALQRAPVFSMAT